MTIRLVHACRSDPGRTHDENQDRWFADPAQGLYLVADGMADERPAQLVVDRLPGLLLTHFQGITDLADPRAGPTVQAALAELNDDARRVDWSGSTLVLALVRERQALLAHLGDSRIYRLRRGELCALTRDHSLVNELLDGGAITQEEAARARSNGGPTRFFGMWGEPVADLRLVELLPDDRLLLCSDGLTGMVRDDVIRDILAQEPDPDGACRRLVEAANAAGGDDNITALVFAALAPSP